MPAKSPSPLLLIVLLIALLVVPTTAATEMIDETVEGDTHITIYDEKEWTQATESAGWSGRAGHTSVVYDGKMWVMGGEDGSTRYNDVWWSTDGITWTQATASAGWSPRHYHTSVVYDGKMWVMGGYDGSTRYNDVWWSTDGITWTQATASAGWSPRNYHTSVVYDGKMWVMGGYDGSLKNDVWWSTDGITWTQATASAGWSVRSAHVSVVYDDKMWVIGGSYKNDVWWSTDGITWTQATESAGWSGRLRHTSVVCDGKMWVMGGYDGLYKNDVWWSTDGITWTQATESAGWSPRHELTSVVYDDKMWVMGGYGQGGSRKNDVWWSTVGEAPTPDPGDQDGYDVTVYVRNSQTGNLLAGSHIIISASVGGEFHEVVNQTLPGGTATYTLQPTGGGLPNPDYYRLIATADGYNPYMPYIDFELDRPTNLIVMMEPITGGPVDENKTFIEFYVRDLSGNGISDASVTCGGYTLITNSVGYTQFEMPKNSIYPYTVRKSGYVTIEGTATVGDGPRYTVNVVMGAKEIPTNPPATDPGGPGATPTPDRRTNEEKGQAVIDMIADNAEGIGALALICLLMGLLKLMAKW